MSGLRFEITAENAGFLRRMEETQRSLKERKEELSRRGRIRLADLVRVNLILLLAANACRNKHIETGAKT